MVIPVNKRIPNLPPYTINTDDHIFKDQTFQVVNDIVNVINNVTTTIISNGTTTIAPVTTPYPKGSVVILGLQPPTYTDAQVTDPTFGYNIAEGTMWYNSTLKKMQFLSVVGTHTPVVAPVVSTITSTP